MKETRQKVKNKMIIENGKIVKVFRETGVALERKLLFHRLLLNIFPFALDCFTHLNKFNAMQIPRNNSNKL